MFDTPGLVTTSSYSQLTYKVLAALPLHDANSNSMTQDISRWQQWQWRAALSPQPVLRIVVAAGWSRHSGHSRTAQIAPERQNPQGPIGWSPYLAAS